MQNIYLKKLRFKCCAVRACSLHILQVHVKWLWMLIHKMSDRIALKTAWLRCPSLSFGRPLKEDLILLADLVDKLHFFFRREVLGWSIDIIIVLCSSAPTSFHMQWMHATVNDNCWLLHAFSACGNWLEQKNIHVHVCNTISNTCGTYTYVLQVCNYKTMAIRAMVGITCTNSFVIEEDLLYNIELSLF